MKKINRILLNEAKGHKLGFTIILILMLATVILEAFAPWPFKILIDNVLDGNPLNDKTILGQFLMNFHTRESLGFFIVFLFFLTSIFLSIIEYIHSIITKKVLKGLIFQFSQTAFRNLETFGISFYRKRNIGDYIYRLSYDVSALGELVEEGIIPIFTSSLYLIATTAIMFTISIKLAILSMIALPFLAVGLYFFNKRIERVSKKSEFWNSQVFSFVEQALNQLKVIQAFSQEKKESKHFDQKVAISLNTDLKLYRLNFLLSLVIGVVIALSYAIIIAYGIRSVTLGEISTGLLIVFIFYLDNLTNPLISVIYAVSIIKETYVKVSRMDDFFNRNNQTPDKGSLTIMNDFSIEFKNVSLSEGEEMQILDNISFNIENNKTTVIVGVSGSGKSSLISLIPRLVSEPDSGEIFIGGRNIYDYDLKTLRSNISLVPQENTLFNDTIKSNISYGNPDCTHEDIVKAAKLAMADEFIEEHPHGYNFKVGESGNFLSGGQRQRIMIARAFLKKARITIFDEPLSSLDLVTREHVWNNIKRFSVNRTTIIVSNVLDVISNADKVIVINKGRIINTGKHSDLLKRSNHYKLIVSKD